MEGDAGLLLSVDEHPVDRRPPAVAGQKRSMQVDAALFRNREDVGTDDLPVVEGKQDVGSDLPNPLDPKGMVDIGGSIHRYALFCRQLRHAVEPDGFPGIIRMRKHGRDVEAVFQECIDACASDIVIGQHNRFQAHILLFSSQVSLPEIRCTKYRGRARTSL